jgi:hypothetical protein
MSFISHPFRPARHPRLRRVPWLCIRAAADRADTGGVGNGFRDKKPGRLRGVGCDKRAGGADTTESRLVFPEISAPGDAR